ncbi:hypothetical protein M8J71_07110 [Pseudarthrobacter sp. R1]|uniref:hypothetical protein n=1 Tax=Pseudarthrobacter sp. R1 TaxID=2944934 RepID=UPI00210B36CD|nr:hypothetical protein [Pseudarthrobacter sp. R1]MCQ6270252.1 hypothetical protein [Pseudarthrobacter sp. R1]
MKRAITTLGVLGLAAFAVTAPAVADRGSDDDNKIVICHAGSGSNSGHFTENMVAVPGLNGHNNHSADIIPPNDGMEHGQNWAAGSATHANVCVVPSVVVPPVENPPAVNPPVENPPAGNTPVENPAVVVQPVEPQIVTPVVEQPPVVPPAAVAPPAATVVVPQQPAAAQPRAAAPQQAAAVPAATTSLGTNQGYNAQTAVGGSDGAPSWLAGLGALFAAGAAVMVRRTSHTAHLTD